MRVNIKKIRCCLQFFGEKPQKLVIWILWNYSIIGQAVPFFTQITNPQKQNEFY